VVLWSDKEKIEKYL